MKKTVKIEMIKIPYDFLVLMNARLDFLTGWDFRSKSIIELLYMAYIQGLTDGHEVFGGKQCIE